jgi:hypothetical protein
VWRDLPFLDAHDAIGRLEDKRVLLVRRLGIEEVAEHGQAVQPTIHAPLRTERMAFAVAAGEAERASTCWIVTT